MNPDEMRARHVRCCPEGGDDPRIAHTCTGCRQLWPCDAAQLLALLTPARLAEALRACGVEPIKNVCQGCRHTAGDHDLNNVRLICGDYFASMSGAQAWDWTVDHLLAELTKAKS